MEHVNYPGQATSFLGLASQSSSYYKECGLAQGCFSDTMLMQLLIMLDLLHDRVWLPIQKVAFNVPFQCDTFRFFYDYAMRNTLQLIPKEMYPQRKPMLSLSEIECSNLKAMDQR